MSRILVPVAPMAGHVNPMLRFAEVLLTTDQKQIVDTVSTIFTAARADDVAMFDSVIAPDFYIFDVGARFNGDSVIASIKALHAHNLHSTSSLILASGLILPRTTSSRRSQAEQCSSHRISKLQARGLDVRKSIPPCGERERERERSIFFLTSFL
jgi:hypothetical protein